MELKVGAIVKAIAGRDADGFFVVTALEDGFVYLADGKSRPLARPKRKNRRHLRMTRDVLELHEITDKKLRTALRQYAAGTTE